jgi:hypothetical protein
MRNYISPQFLDKCEKALVEALDITGRKLLNRTIDGYEEKYVHAGISDTNLEIYIYIDGAGISGPEVDFRFEWPDYDSESEIINDFIRKTLVATGDSAAS